MKDTIAAIGTPVGEGAISIVRVSGRDAIRCVSCIFRGKKSPEDIKKSGILYGWIYEGEEPVDEVLLFVMRAPHTYTGEDMVEISTHGGYMAARKVLFLVLKNGARLAKPGEFTMRAFLNGRIDLVRAESVLDVIRAKTEKGLKVAEQTLRGSLTVFINKIKERIIELASLLEVNLDFPEEDIPPTPIDEMVEKINGIIEELEKLKKTYRVSRVLREGAIVPIAGRPNVGKSSLFNLLLREEKAIVTSVPGTTRDVLEGWIDIDGYPVKLLDTAGIRKSEDLVERIGVERAMEKTRDADIVLLVLDASEPLTDDDRELIKEFSDGIIILNKIDLGIRIKDRDILEKGIRVSALTGEGLDELHSALQKKLETTFPVHSGEVFLTRERYIHSIESAIENMERAIEKLRETGLEELASFELNSAAQHLKEITGEITDEDVLEKIFSEYCIGK